MSQILYCSFCRKPDTSGVRLIEGPGVLICEGCIILCARALSQCTPRLGGGAAARIDCGHSDCSTDTLLSLLGGQDATLRDVRDRLQTTIKTLRARDVSWEKIGKALGCSRQAAWERFGGAPATVSTPRVEKDNA
jgi:ClpX C4-type zinc finger